MKEPDLIFHANGLVTSPHWACERQRVDYGRAGETKPWPTER